MIHSGDLINVTFHLDYIGVKRFQQLLKRNSILLNLVSWSTSRSRYVSKAEGAKRSLNSNALTKLWTFQQQLALWVRVSQQTFYVFSILFRNSLRYRKSFRKDCSWGILRPIFTCFWNLQPPWQTNKKSYIKINCTFILSLLKLTSDRVWKNFRTFDFSYFLLFFVQHYRNISTQLNSK